MSKGLSQHVEFTDPSCAVPEEKKGQSEDVAGSGWLSTGLDRDTAGAERRGQTRGSRGRLVK